MPLEADGSYEGRRRWRRRRPLLLLLLWLVVVLLLNNRDAIYRAQKLGIQASSVLDQRSHEMWKGIFPSPASLTIGCVLLVAVLRKALGSPERFLSPMYWKRSGFDKGVWFLQRFRPCLDGMHPLPLGLAIGLLSWVQTH